MISYSIVTVNQIISEAFEKFYNCPIVHVRSMKVFA